MCIHGLRSCICFDPISVAYMCIRSLIMPLFHTSSGPYVIPIWFGSLPSLFFHYICIYGYVEFSHSAHPTVRRFDHTYIYVRVIATVLSMFIPLFYDYIYEFLVSTVLIIPLLHCFDHIYIYMSSYAHCFYHNHVYPCEHYHPTILIIFIYINEFLCSLLLIILSYIWQCLLLPWSWFYTCVYMYKFHFDFGPTPTCPGSLLCPVPCALLRFVLAFVIAMFPLCVLLLFSNAMVISTHLCPYMPIDRLIHFGFG